MFDQMQVCSVLCKASPLSARRDTTGTLQRDTGNKVAVAYAGHSSDCGVHSCRINKRDVVGCFPFFSFSVTLSVCLISSLVVCFSCNMLSMSWISSPRRWYRRACELESISMARNMVWADSFLEYGDVGKYLGTPMGDWYITIVEMACIMYKMDVPTGGDCRNSKGSWML